MSNPEKIAESLGQAKNHGQYWACRCPCHDDKKASLIVSRGENGVMVNCLAGCNWQDIKNTLQEMGLIKRKQKKDVNVEPRPAVEVTHWPDKELPRMQKQIVRTPRKQSVAYIYKGLDGKEAFRKERHAGKVFYFKYPDNKKPDKRPIYNLQALPLADTIYICEGEKDADALISRGLVATTNATGAANWDDTNDDVFTGKNIIICEDKDDAGALRTEKLAARFNDRANSVRVLHFRNLDRDKGYDVSDWIAEGNDVAKIETLAVDARGLVPVSPLPVNRKAKRDDYFQLFDSVLKAPKKCVFAGKLMTDVDGIWQPAINYIDRIKSYAAVETESGGKKYNLNLIKPHFSEFEYKQKAQLLVDIPEWDGRDRIAEMAAWVRLNKIAGISSASFAELLKEWCSKMFERLVDPMIQNRILVLTGDQGKGKDSWTSLLIDGLGQFAVNLSVVSGDKDTFLSLHTGLVMRISEFDKTAKTEVSVLKDIITTPRTNIRAPYDTDTKIRFARCSFISSANIANILRDYTGNRRFLIFEIDHIDFVYESWTAAEIKQWQMQCLAQSLSLSCNRYRAGKEAWQQCDNYIEQNTPSDPAKDLQDEFWCLYQREEIQRPRESESDLANLGIFKKLKELTGLNVRAIRNMLRHRPFVVFTNRTHYEYNIELLAQEYNEQFRESLF